MDLEGTKFNFEEDRKFNFKEEVTRLIFEKTFGQKFPRIRPEWLINEDGHRMEIDGCNLELSIGFEYNGRQHYQEGHFGMDSEKLKKRIRDDECKERLCKEHGVDLMIVKYTDELNLYSNKIYEISLTDC